MAARSGSSALRLAACMAILSLAAPVAWPAEHECATGITAELKSSEKVDEGVRLEFEIELTSEEACVEATYDLILVEVLPNGQWKSVRQTRRIEVRDGTALDLVEHVMSSDLTLLEYEARMVECSPCERRERAYHTISTSPATKRTPTARSPTR